MPTLSKSGSTPTSISVLWPYIRPHDSAYDAGSVQRYFLKYKMYNQTASPLIFHTVDSPGTKNLTGLEPSTRYSFQIQIEYYSIKTGTVTGPLGPMSNLQTESCAGKKIILNHFSSVSQTLHYERLKSFSRDSCFYTSSFLCRRFLLFLVFARRESEISTPDLNALRSCHAKVNTCIDVMQMSLAFYMQ
jgi:hypothetical protein